MTWALLPAAGSGRRFGGEVPKQYLHAAGKPLIEHALDALLSHPGVDGVVVALAADDARWPDWTSLHGKPVITCSGGGERADSVLAALRALPGALRFGIFSNSFRPMYMNIAFLMKAREILRFQILLVVITKLFLRLKLIRAFALSLRRDDLSWRIFLIMKNALKSCEKLNQKRTNQQNCD